MFRRKKRRRDLTPGTTIAIITATSMAAMMGTITTTKRTITAMGSRTQRRNMPEPSTGSGTTITATNLTSIMTTTITRITPPYPWELIVRARDS